MASSSSEHHSNMMKTCFQHFDKDGDGTISKAELRAMLHDWSDQDINDLLISFDKDTDLSIDYDEFVDWVMCTAHSEQADVKAEAEAAAKAKPKAKAKVKAKAKMAKAKAKGKGKAKAKAKGKAKAKAKAKARAQDDKEAMAMKIYLKSFDKNGDGKISKEELEAFNWSDTHGQQYIFAMFDKDDDGFIDYAEFVDWVMASAGHEDAAEVSSEEEGEMNVFILDNEGIQLGEFEVKLGHTVRKFKAYLASLRNVNVQRLQLLHDEEILGDTWRWHDTSVDDRDTLTLVMTDKEYLDDETIYHAVEDYCRGGEGKDEVERRFGHISQWDTSNVTNMKHLLRREWTFNEDLNAWNVENVTDMSEMFHFATKFNGDLSKWDVSSVTDMRSMFEGAAVFNGILSSWNVESVTDMHGMFQYADLFNADLSAWDVGNVTNMGLMFQGANIFNTDLSAWSLNPHVDTDGMFDEVDIDSHKKPKGVE